MPRHHLLAATLGLGLFTGFLHLRNASEGDAGNTSGTSTAILPLAEPSASTGSETSAGGSHGRTGISIVVDASDHTAPEAYPPADPEMSLATMAEALRSAPDAVQKGEWADRIAAVGGREAVEQLVTLATGEQDEESIQTILEAFKGLSDPQDILLLASASTATSDFRILEAATEMISRSATPQVVEYLAEISRQPPLQPTQRFAALWAIERIQNPEALRGLAKLVHHAPEPDLARAAAVALARIGGPLGATILTESAVDRHPDSPDFQQLVREVAANRHSSTDPAGIVASWAWNPEGNHP